MNRSEKNGLTLQVSDSLSAYHEFLKLYDVMWERKRFETTVNVEEFGKIQENLPAGYKMHTFIAYKDGKPVAALVVSLYGDSCIYILGATNDQARELKASYFLHWQVILWLKEHCARVYDLGGVNPQINPGGYHFKSGFGGTEFARLNTYSCSSDLFGRGWAILAGWKHR